MVLNFDCPHYELKAIRGRDYLLPLALETVQLCAPTLVHLRLEGLTVQDIEGERALGTGTDFKVGAYTAGTLMVYALFGRLAVKG